MHSNVIVFSARASVERLCARQLTASAHDNVVELAGWIGRSMPRRTPNGVFFTTPRLTPPGDIA